MNSILPALKSTVFSSGFKVLFCVILVFVVIGYSNLENYNIYEGKIIGFEDKTVVKSGFRTGRIPIKLHIPEVEYYKGKDTIEFQDGRMRLVTNFEVGEKIKVLENRENPYQTQIYSLFYYWISYEVILIVFLVFAVIYGIIRLFKTS